VKKIKKFKFSKETIIGIFLVLLLLVALFDIANWFYQTRISNKKMRELENLINIDDINPNGEIDYENDEEAIEKEIEDIIGSGSVEKINNKRLSDGYNKMTLDVEIAVLTCIYKTYITATSGTMVDEIIETNRNMENRVKDLGNVNRVERRNYNRNQYRRNYRRY